MKQSQDRLLDRSQIAREVERLYLEADIASPSADYPIAPLGPLLDRLPVRRQETPGLTSLWVRNELLALGALAAPNEFGEATEEPMAGFFYACGRYAWIYVRAEDRIARKRFSAAHELGHYWIHYRPLVAGASLSEKATAAWRDDFAEDQAAASEEGSIRNGDTATQAYAQQEREANAFAAELLMPESVIRGLIAQWKSLGRGRDLAARLAESLLVSREAMKIRLQSLGIQG